MLNVRKLLLIGFICLVYCFTHAAFTNLLSRVRLKTANAPLSLPPSPKIKPVQSGYNFPRQTSRYEQWPYALMQLRDLVYGKYNSVNESFSPFIGKGIAKQELQRFPKQYINIPYVEKPVAYKHGWQVTNRTLLNTIIERTKNPDIYDFNEQKELVQIALDKGANPLQTSEIEKTAPGFMRELQGNALEVALKFKNIGALEALITYLEENDLIDTIDESVKKNLITVLNNALENASDEEKERIQKLIDVLKTKRIESHEALN